MRIALVADHLSWCFGHCARGIAKYAPSEFEVEVFDAAQFQHFTDAPKVLEKRFDAVCQFAWAEATVPLPVRNVLVLAHEGAMFPKNGDWPAALLTTAMRNLSRAAQVLPLADDVLCFTPRLADFTRQLGQRPIWTAPGVDLEIFQPRPHATRNKLTVGWCGQPAPQKGYEQILRPLMERLNARTGPQVEWRINTRTAANALSQQEMAEWHNGNDLFLCTSISEGGPLTILEALACGVPVISTQAGIAAHVAGITLLPRITKPEDYPAIVAMAAVEIAEAKPDRDAAREAAMPYGWDALAPDWLRRIAG